MDFQTPTIDRYSSDIIERKLNIDREKLIALALILGCDYGPKGLPGVGKERALPFVQNWNDTDGSILHG